MRDQRAVAAILTILSALLLPTLAWDHPWSHGLLALVVGVFPAGLIYLATVGRPGRGRLRLALVALAMLLSGSLAALVIIAREPSPVVLLGFPATLWIMLGGLTLLPLVLVACVYALGFRLEDSHPSVDAIEPREDEGVVD